ncbi:MAG: hypothetical protein AB1445_01790 [Bacillota bacterium]
MARSSPGETKYLICNGDEGAPGAFMDRGVMEGDSHRVVEGVAIAAPSRGTCICEPSTCWLCPGCTRPWQLPASTGFWARTFLVTS